MMFLPSVPLVRLPMSFRLRVFFVPPCSHLLFRPLLWVYHRWRPAGALMGRRALVVTRGELRNSLGRAAVSRQRRSELSAVLKNESGIHFQLFPWGIHWSQ